MSLKDKLGSQLKAGGGFGLPTSAIASAMTEQAASSNRIDARHIPIEAIYTEAQVREINQDAVDEIAATIRDSKTGQPETPIKVWANPDGRFLVLFGEHRFHAQKMNHSEYPDDRRFDTILALVHSGECPKGHDRAKLQLQENMLRTPVTPIEIALAVRAAQQDGVISSLPDAIRWLGLEDSPKKGTVTKELSQAISLLSDETAQDLVEAVQTGQMKVYKAAEELKERRRQSAAEAAAAAAKEAVQAKEAETALKIQELQEQLLASQNRVAELLSASDDAENSAGVDTQDLANLDPEIQDELAQEENRQRDIEAAIQQAREEAPTPKAPKPEKKPAERPARFSLDYADAIKMLRVLDSVASEFDLPNLNFDREQVSRKVWDSILADRLPEIYAAVTGEEGEDD